MAEKKGATIVIKKVQGGHAGAHGGAWKVAFADFMTALMCFFLVMWLLGSDEEVKSSIATYFNSPTSNWRMDLNDKAQPLGDKTAAGESVLAGNEGLTPEDLIQKPTKSVNPETTAKDVTPQILEDAMREKPNFPVNIEYMKFTLREKDLYKPGTDELTAEGKSQLTKISTLFKTHKGSVRLERKADETPYELALSRLVSLSQFLSEQRFVDEERISTKVVPSEDGKRISDGDQRVEVILLKN